MLSFLYPARCPRCDRVFPLWEDASEGICSECRKTLPIVKDPFCMKCGRQLLKRDEEYCSDCRKRSHPYESGRALFVYDEDMKQMMYRFKYSARREYARSFGAMALELRGAWLKEQRCELIVPIPMHPAKKRRRGYNQAEDFAAELEKGTGIRNCPSLVRRDRDTKALKGLAEKERKEQLRGAFSVDQEEMVRFLKENRPARILLVDDIYTTGSTADAVALTIIEEIRKLCNEDAKISVLAVCTGEDA